jgi:CDP-diacylglycerol---glycerol-3-phosphate 3-phosphatidyltransferase
VSHGAIPDRVAEGTRSGLSPIARAVASAGVSANTVTLLGGTLTLIGSALVAVNAPLLAIVVLAVGTIADTLDGQVAKAHGGGTKLGAFLDSTIDRVSDSALLAGAVAHGAAYANALLVWSGLIALVASSLVPYIRAKAESLGATAAVGPAPREARIVIYLAGVALWALSGSDAALLAAVALIALLSSITAALRAVHVGRQLQAKGR